MPYKKVKVKGKVVVQKADGGQVMGEHPDEASADAQIAAIEASENRKGGMFGQKKKPKGTAPPFMKP